MSEEKKANLFAKLARQAGEPVQASPQPSDPVAEEAPPSPAPPAPAKPKASAKGKKADAPGGRRANPDYCQANAYILKTVRRSVDKALFDLEGMDYSTLVEELLVKWLKTRRVSE